MRQSQAMPPACAHVLRVPLVASKELVAAVATEHDFHLSRRFPGQIPRRHTRGIGKRIVKIGNDSLEIVNDPLIHRNGAIGEAEPLGCSPGIGAFVE